MKVYMDCHHEGVRLQKRKVVEVELVKKRAKSVLVKLPNGDIIKRRLRDIVEETA